MTVTADGRDLTHAEWRRIPGFPKYQITPDGDVRNTRTGRLVNEWFNKTTGTWAYSLWRGDGTKTNRTYQALLAATYPERET